MAIKYATGVATSAGNYCETKNTNLYMYSKSSLAFKLIKSELFHERPTGILIVQC